MTEVILYTKPDCPLCEKGKAIVTEAVGGLDATVREVDISGDSRLMKAYGIRIPVVVIDGELVTCGRLDRSRILAKLAAVGPQQQ